MSIFAEAPDTKQDEEDIKKKPKKKTWDFSLCPNKYLVTENLCPAELLIRHPGEWSCGNRTCPYREGSRAEREQGVKG